MKKIYLLMLACISVMYSYAAGSLVIPNVEIPQGGIVYVPINISTDESFSDAGGDIYTNNSALSITAAQAGDLCTDHSTTCTDKSGFYRFTCATTSGTMFKALTGNILYLKFEDSGANAVGTVYSCNTAGWKLARSGYAVEPAQVNFTVTVVDHYTVSENSTWIPFAKSGAKVLVDRAFTANQFSTVCLPFGLTAANQKLLFGDAVEVYNFTGVDYDDSNESLALNFTTLTGSMVPGAPYIVKPSASQSSYTFNSIALNANTTEAKQIGITEEAVTFTDIIFKGNYVAGAAVPANDLYLMSDGKFYTSSGAVKMKATRAYISISDFLAASGISFVKESNLYLDGILTSIDALDADGITADGWYDLNGRKLGAKPATKGIYINNGKKVIVK